jgi:hypothetical protein
MCCVLSILLFLGPRAWIVIWWLVDPARWERVYSHFIVPFIGFIFLPWTTITYVLLGPHGLHGLEWFFIGIAVVADVATFASSAYDNRQRVARPA